MRMRDCPRLIYFSLRLLSFCFPLVFGFCLVVFGFGFGYAFPTSSLTNSDFEFNFDFDSARLQTKTLW